MSELEVQNQNNFTPTNRYLLSGCNFISCHWCLKMVSLLFRLMNVFLINRISLLLEINGL